VGKNRYGVEIKPAKYHAGISVIVTFPKVGGLKLTRIRGYIRSVKGRFLDTPALAEFRYEIILDKKYCSSISFSVRENMIREAPDKLSF
jgi:hypothetical protein